MTSKEYTFSISLALTMCAESEEDAQAKFDKLIILNHPELQAHEVEVQGFDVDSVDLSADE